MLLVWFWRTSLTSSNLAFSEVSNQPAVAAEGGGIILGFSFTLPRYKYHCGGVRGHVGMRTGRDVDVAINNSAELGFTSNSYNFICAV